MKFGAQQLSAASAREQDRALGAVHIALFSRVSGDLTLAVCFSARVASRKAIPVASATVEQESIHNIQSSLMRRDLN